MDTALTCGKQVEGHGSGIKGSKLVAFAASGVSSCHESINLSEAMEKLRLGIYVMIREGSIRRDLQAVSEVKESSIDFRRLCLVTDGLNGEDLISMGHMDYIVQKAINLGIDPIKAFQMATINTAEHFGLDNIIGGVAPGRLADIVILPSLTRIECEYVISKGKIVAKEGKSVRHPKKCTYPETVLKSVHVPGRVQLAQFGVLVKGKENSVKVRVMKLIAEIITSEYQVKLPVVDSLLLPDLAQDILKISVIDRQSNTGKTVTGFIQGFGLTSGAVASSYSWAKGTPIVVIGTNDQDMAMAANRVIDLQGGLVIADKGEIPAELPFPIGGCLPLGPLEKINHTFSDIRRTLRQMGCTLNDPYLTLQTTTGVGLPFFRITVQGLVDLKNQKAVELIVE
jgi:adenine deaminase